MLNIFSVEEAKQGILKRQPPDEFPVSQTMLEGIAKVFGETLTPEQAVTRILADVRRQGDKALQEWSQRLDNRKTQSFRVPAEKLSNALKSISDKELAAIKISVERVRRFHERQPLNSWMMQEGDGTLGQFIRPIKRVGLYVPGGTAPLPSTVIMSAVPAQVAGVKEIVVVVPPNRATGEIADITLAACAFLGLKEVYTLGGAQAIAALAYGTETIRAVDKIFGPGNLFVTLAKRQVFGVVGIDGLAGPTETMVIADETAAPGWVAADLLAQAEHDVLASAILLTPSRELAEEVQAEVARRVESLPRAEILAQSLQRRSGAVITHDIFEAAELANAYAPEHLCLSVADPWGLSEKIEAAGGVFLGEHSFEALGDYIAGPSHVMPTNGTARFASPLNVWDFVHIVSLVALNREFVSKLSKHAAALARAEGLEAHAQAADERTSA
jgi:histidinol dehydrogenase